MMRIRARIDIEEPQDVAPGFLRHGDHRIGHFGGGFFQPGRTIVAVPQLFTFPRAERFQRMNRQNHRNMVIELGQNTAEMGVPGVAMNDICVDADRVEVRTTTDCAKHGIQILGTTKSRRVNAESS